MRQTQPREVQVKNFEKEVELPDTHSLQAFTARERRTRSRCPSRTSAQLRPGKNLIQLSVTGNNSLPYTLTWSYRTQKPANDPKAPIKIATKLSSEIRPGKGTP